jgi:phytoene dehydrogenase-like protein
MADVLGDLLGSELHSRRALRLAGRLGRRQGVRGSLDLAREVVGSGRSWLETTFSGPEPARMFAPWVLHTGMTPDQGGSWLQLLGISVGLQLGGAPIPRGGGQAFVTAFERLIVAHGGRLRTGVDVTEIRTSAGRRRLRGSVNGGARALSATAIRRRARGWPGTAGARAVSVIAGDEEIAARRAIVANVTPTQLYGRLLAPGAAPAAAFEQAARYRYGRADMQIHLALDAPLVWRDERLRDVAIVNVTEGLDAVSLACAQAQAGLLPSAPTIAFGQPTVLDPSRAPEGKAIGWIQLLEMPSRVRGDAAGELPVPADGAWTPGLGEAYAQRVLDLVERQAPNLREVLLDYVVLTPADLERRNVNLVGGDPYGGALSLEQHFLWRPLPSFGSHATPVAGLHQCGASTFPGPGLGGASGRIVAQTILRQDRRRLRRA